LNKRNIPLLLFFTLLLIGGQIGSQNPSQASASAYRVSVGGPSLSSTFGEQLPGVVVGQQAVLALVLDGTLSEDYVAIVEIRDERGITSEIMLKTGELTVGDTSTLRFSWTPVGAGNFYAKAIVISSLESPEVLSEISQSSIKVVTSMAEFDQLFQDPQDETPTDDTPANPAAYTFLVYMVASDLESTGYYGTLDILEMMSVGSTDNVNVIVQTGGSANSTVDDFRFIDFTQVQRHEILKDDIKTVSNLGKKNMASSTTLSDFVSWGVKEYPGEKYVIILWDHGAGMIGFGYDDIYDDTIDLAELREGLYPIVQQGKQFEIIGFDACLMASIEVANALTGRGKYLVASEELEPAWGMDFAAILSSIDENPDQDGVALGRVISDSYIAHARENGGKFEDYNADVALTMSVIDLAKVPALFKDVSDVGTYFDRKGGDMEITHSITKIIRETERYGESGKSSTGNLDLYHLAENIDKEFPEALGIASQIRDRVDEAVVYKVGGEAKQDSHGISMFMQVEQYEDNAPYLKYIVGKWISVLTFARQTLERDDTPPDIALSMRKDKVITGKIEGNDISFVSTFIMQDVEDNRLRLKIVSIVDDEPSDFIKPNDEGFISYNWSRTIMSMCNADDQDCKSTSLTYEKNGRTKYAYVPVRLESDRFNGTLVLIYIVDATNKFEFLGGWPGVDENENAIRELVPLVDGDRVYLSSYMIQYNPSDDETYFDIVEEPEPIVVSEGFGPAYHKYAGEYKLAISACDFSGNCNYSSDYVFDVK
jgi:cysteine peptidase C11 family protein